MNLTRRELELLILSISIALVKRDNEIWKSEANHEILRDYSELHKKLINQLKEMDLKNEKE